MKRYFYIVAFMFLGLLLSQLVHSVVEMPLLGIMARDLAATGESWLAEYWWLVHDIGGVLLSLAGLAFGFAMGRKYWRIIYVEHRRGVMGK